MKLVFPNMDYKDKAQDYCGAGTLAGTQKA